MKSVESKVPSLQVNPLISRKAVGEGLFELFEEFSILARHEAVQLPRNDTKQLDPRVDVIKNRHLHANEKKLRPLKLKARNLASRLKPILPELALPIEGVVAEEVAWSQSKSGLHYLSLCFDRDTVEQLDTEQAEIWETLPEIAGKSREEADLNWQPTDPRLLVITFGADVPYSPVARSRARILRRAPFDLTLLPVGEDRAAAAALID